jgi:predicted RNase H-like HicB family nuclease
VSGAIAEQIRSSTVIHWSDENDAFLVTLPEWEGRIINPVTHGGSYEEAVRHGTEVLVSLVELVMEQGKTLPPVRQEIVAAFRSDLS